MLNGIIQYIGKICIASAAALTIIGAAMVMSYLTEIAHQEMLSIAAICAVVVGWVFGPPK